MCKFIVVEGLDGSGKGTQIKRLKKNIEALGRRVSVSAEPTDGYAGKMCREVLSGEKKVSAETLAAFFAADRICHNEDIEKLLFSGYDVISDRYYYSSCAYQGMGDEEKMKWIYKMNRGCGKIRQPDICIFLDVDADECMERIEKGRDKKEIYEKADVLRKVRASFMKTFEIFDEKNVFIIDSNGDEDTVEKRIWDAVKNNLS